MKKNICSTILKGKKIHATTDHIFILERTDLQGLTITVNDVGYENIYFNFVDDAGAIHQGMIK